MISAARKPLPIVLVNGAIIDGVMAADVQSDSFFSANRFSLRAALAGSGQATWSAVPLFVEIRMNLDGSETSLISGNADRMTIDPIRGEVHVSGRDLASVFVGSQTDQSFENQTSSDIAILLAARHGMDADITPTTALIGRYYQSGRTRTTLTQHARATTEWDLLCWLAQLESFDVWVDGNTLYFHPTLNSTASFTLAPTDCLSLELHRALDIATGVTVVVKSWDCLTQSTIVGSATSGNANGLGIIRTVVRPNLSADDAQSLAARLVQEITVHERQILVEMPGELIITPRMVMALSGTGSDFDGSYSICAVTRSISFARGYTQSVEARSLPWTAS